MKEITFIPVSEEATSAPPPVAASKTLPDWYKNIPAFPEGNKPTFKQDGSVDRTVRMCTPYSDALRFGYVQNTWTEINVSVNEQNEINYFYATAPKILGHRDRTDLPKDYLAGHYPIEFVWQMQYQPKLPKGYSVLITHPLNRQDLPFTTLSGIIDADDYYHFGAGNLPFLLKDGFSGIIPLGTPMFQIIPFKRDDWKSMSELFDAAKEKNGKDMSRFFWSGYKKLIWKKKTFK